MSVKRRIGESLAKLAFDHREAEYHHHSYDEDMRQYELMKQGDLSGARESGKKMFEGPNTGSLADDPVKNYQYLFVASMTLACRFCIEGGLPSEDAFNLSDLYIRQADRCRTVEELFALHDTMVSDLTLRMQAVQRKEVYSRQVHLCLDYVDQHLQQPLTVEAIAAELGLSPAYLSTVFKKETGVAVSEHIRRRRVDTAKTLLQYTEFTCLEIAEYLCFASDSHFSQVFRRYSGQTPTEFRKKHFRKHWDQAVIQQKDT